MLPKGKYCQVVGGKFWQIEYYLKPLSDYLYGHDGSPGLDFQMFV